MPTGMIWAAITSSLFALVSTSLCSDGRRFKIASDMQERQLNPLLSSVSASILDQERFPTLTKTFLNTVVFLHRWGWRTIDALALGAVVAGASMLYLKKSCPYDFLLLLPAIFQVGLSFMTWGIVVAWSRLLRAGVRIFGMRIFGPQIPSPTTAKNTVVAFASPLPPNECFAGQITSQPRAGPGHRHRSSDNFSIDVPPSCYGLRVAECSNPGKAINVARRNHECDCACINGSPPRGASINSNSAYFCPTRAVDVHIGTINSRCTNFNPVRLNL